MNKSVMGCCICNNYKKGEFIIINDKKYHLSCIENMPDIIEKAIEYGKAIDNRNTYIEISELRHLVSILESVNR